MLFLIYKYNWNKQLTLYINVYIYEIPINVPAGGLRSGSIYINLGGNLYINKIIYINMNN